VVVNLELEGFLENEVVVGMEGNHEILVDGACSDGEVASVSVKSLLSNF
jgi:hypothetical protein